MSVIYNPVKDQLYFAQKGHGAYLNNQPIKVSDNIDVKDSVVMTHFSSKKEARVRTIILLENVFNQTMQLRVLGSGSASLCYIAQGLFDVFFNVKTYAWDILPGAFLVQEAGGMVTDINGNKITLQSDSILASNSLVHKQMLDVLKEI